MHLLLDTNILIDHLARRRPFCDDVRKLCIAQAFGDVKLWVNVQSYVDACYILRKQASQRELRDLMIESLKLFSPCGTHASDLQPALESNWPDVEDFLLAYSGVHVDVDYILTRDPAGFTQAPVPALSPSEFLAFLKEEKGWEYDNL